MSKAQYKQFNLKTKVLDEQNRIIEMVGSTEDYDRVGDSMKMAGAILTNYLRNPVILANHNYGNSEKPSVIGRTLDLNIVGHQLIFKIQFAETDNGKEWFYLYSNNYMNASSIGFIPLEYKPNDHGGYDFTKWELLELSLVSVPCNPNAIQRAFTEGKISKSFFNTIKNIESEVKKDMKDEEVKALISKAVNAKVKSIKDEHQKELDKKDEEIKELNGKIAALEIKAGAKLSKATLDTLTKACEGIKEHVKGLEALVVGDDGEDDDDNLGNDPEAEKDYTEEEIQKMVEDKIKKAIEGAE